MSVLEIHHTNRTSGTAEPLSVPAGLLASDVTGMVNAFSANKSARWRPAANRLVISFEGWLELSGSNQPCLQKVDLRPSIHLPFHQFELRDLPLGLAVRPWLGDGGTDGGLVVGDATRERRN